MTPTEINLAIHRLAALVPPEDADLLMKLYQLGALAIEGVKQRAAEAVPASGR